MEWQHVITGTLTAAVLAYLVKLAARPPDVQGDVLVLRYPRVLSVIVWVGIVVFGGGAIAVSIPLVMGTASAKDERTAVFALPTCLVFLAGFVAGLREMRVTLHVDREGIRGRTAFRGHRSIAWREVAEVKWAPANKWLVLVDRSGNKLRVSILLRGHEAVVMALREHVPEPVWRKAVAAWEQAPKNLF